jgi:AMP-polyphosphate phosphotransferase
MKSLSKTLAKLKKSHEDKDDLEEEIKALQLKMLRIQQGIWHQKERVIIMFEGFDAAGKGGAIRSLTEVLDPRGVKVLPVGAPSSDEQGRHYLYRFWRDLPRPGDLIVFDRSWYGRVLVEKVDELIPAKRIKEAYDEINQFERMLQADGIRIIKIFLAISKDEQLERLEARLSDPYKQWKISMDDIKARKKWDDYVEAVDEIFRKTDLSESCWHLIPADNKKFARREVLKIVTKTLQDCGDWMDSEAAKKKKQKLGVKIDVIIPTFNRAPLLERAIESVLKQTFQDFVLHVVDDGSTDETPSILARYKDHPLVQLHSQSNRGVSAARNLAAKSAQGDWLSFLDSDDEWLPQKLEAQVRQIKTSPELRFFHGEEIWMRNGVRVNPKAKHSKAQLDIVTASLEFCLISPSTVIMKKDLFFDHGGFDETLEVCEDFDLWNKILVTEKVGFLNEFVTKKYGGHPDQLSTKFVGMDYWRIKSLLKLRLLPKISAEIKNLIDQIVERKSDILLKGYLKHQNLEKYQEIKVLLKKAFTI